MAGRDGEAVRFEARRGGSPYNVAVGLARLGAQVGFLSGISQDFLGTALLDALRAEGVATNYVVMKQAPTTLSLVMLDEAGVPSYAFYGAGAADRAVSLRDLPLLDPAVGCVHFGSYSLVCEPAGGTYLALGWREAKGRLISVDPNVRLTVAPDVALWRGRVADWVKLAHVIKVSAEDLHALYPGVAPLDMARGWVREGVGLVVVTRGGDGAFAVTAHAYAEVAAPKVRVVDTVGAGDAFQAALLHRLDALGCRGLAELVALTEEDLRHLLGFAAMAGALACGRAGADLPRIDEVLGALVA